MKQAQEENSKVTHLSLEKVRVDVLDVSDDQRLVIDVVVVNVRDIGRTAVEIQKPILFASGLDDFLALKDTLPFLKRHRDGCITKSFANSFPKCGETWQFWGYDRQDRWDLRLRKQKPSIKGQQVEWDNHKTTYPKTVMVEKWRLE